MSTDQSSLDQRLASIAVARGLVPEGEMAACLAEQRQADAEGRPPVRMAQLLVRRGLIGTEDLVRLLKEAQQPAADDALSSTDQEQSEIHSLPAILGTPVLQGRTHLSRYELVREIARGGMGVVYEAIDPDLKRRVALKVLKDAEGKEDHIKRLNREAAVAARLSHPNIIPIHEVGAAQEAGDRRPIHFIAMDYVEGQTLADAAERLDMTARMEILRQVSEAVGYAHQQKVIHRDLKPANILLTSDDRPIVTDFGLARQTEDNTNLTVSGAVMGTSHYMAPEQVLGRAKQIDARCDVWALGVMMYELLADKRPFEGTTQAEVYHGILRIDPPPPRGKHRVDKDLQTICLKALEKEIPRRYGNGQEIAEELRRWKEGAPIKARPPSTLYRLQKLVKRHPWLISGVLLWVLLIGLAGWWGHTVLGISRDFDALKEQAAQLVANKQWASALVACQQAMALRSDDQVESWLALCREKLEEQRRERELQLQRHEAFKELQEQIQPISRKIEETRPFVNIPRVAISGKLAQVEHALQDLVKIAGDPKFERWRFPDAWALLGSGYYLVGRMPQAEAALLEAADPSRRSEIPDWWVNYYLGRIYLRRALAVQVLTALPDHPLREPRFNEQALVYLSRPMDDWEGAKPIDKDVARTFRLLAARKLDQVIARCDAGLKDYMGTLDVAQYWHIRGYARAGEQRLADWDIALKRRPQDAWIAYMRGATYQLAGKRKPALTDYDRALRIDRYLAYAYNNRGVLREQDGQHAKALADFEAAIAHDPRLAGPLCNAGGLLAGQRKYVKAMALLERASKIGAAHWQVWWLYGQLLALRQRKTLARQALGKARRLAPPAVRPRIDALLRKLD